MVFAVKKRALLQLFSGYLTTALASFESRLVVAEKNNAMMNG